MLDSSLEHQLSLSEILGVTFSKNNKDSPLVHDRPRQWRTEGGSTPPPPEIPKISVESSIT